MSTCSLREVEPSCKCNTDNVILLHMKNTTLEGEF